MRGVPLRAACCGGLAEEICGRRVALGVCLVVFPAGWNRATGLPVQCIWLQNQKFIFYRLKRDGGFLLSFGYGLFGSQKKNRQPIFVGTRKVLESDNAKGTCLAFLRVTRWNNVCSRPKKVPRPESRQPWPPDMKEISMLTTDSKASVTVSNIGQDPMPPDGNLIC